MIVNVPSLINVILEAVSMHVSLKNVVLLPDVKHLSMMELAIALKAMREIQIQHVTHVRKALKFNEFF